MNILGVHIGHDSSAALVRDGKLLADVAEERFIRIKHYAGVPSRAIDVCLREGGITMDDVDFIAIPTSQPVTVLNHLFDLPPGRRETGSLKSRTLQFARKMSGSHLQMPPLYWRRFPVLGKTKIVHIDHHLAHAASAYYPSGLAGRVLVVTCDGAGDGASLCVWRGEGGVITPLKRWGVEASIGWFYSNVTEGLGWIHGDGEGKTMGLAPYGDPEKCRGVLSPFHPKFHAGDLVEPHDFGTPYNWNEEGYFEFHFDEANVLQKLVQKHGRENMAAEAQRVLEEQFAQIIYPWLEREKTRQLACSGGVFLNVKLNQRIWYSGKVGGHFIYPNPGDAGLAVGAALQVYHEQSGDRQVGSPMQHLYWGPQYANQEIETILQHRHLAYRRSEAIEEETAELLAKGAIIGWLQGRMESGPRALGNRSILMSAAKAENKDIINTRVKYREGFRPFCPSMTDEAKADYLVNPRDEPYMITSFDTVPDKKGRIPAVVHADGTARPQTVRRDSNERYWKLLDCFGKLTGDPVLLNTSFNIKGEPMICSPREAIRCFYDTGLDHLVLGDFIVNKA